ncbi:hypothetical protein ACTTBJ_21110, partial [Shewanella frigidimarina]|uniref:hypothetical protein n=1 Tax=Shewanella frigidimarina TaxID=56812 RepID=UPI003F9FD0D8
DSKYEINSVVYQTITYTYMMPWNNSVSVGVNNLTDEKPAFEQNGTYSTDLYDIMGRSYWVSFSQSF